MSQIRNRDERAAARLEHAEQFTDSHGLLREREVFQNVEAQHLVERAVGVRVGR